VILPFLRYQQINKLSTLVISHADNDHRGGAISILKALPVDRILTSVPKKFPSYAVSTCHQGQSWQWDGVGFDRPQ